MFLLFNFSAGSVGMILLIFIMNFLLDSMYFDYTLLHVSMETQLKICCCCYTVIIDLIVLFSVLMKIYNKLLIVSLH